MIEYLWDLAHLRPDVGTIGDDPTYVLQLGSACSRPLAIIRPPDERCVITQEGTRICPSSDQSACGSLVAAELEAVPHKSCRIL